MLTEQPSTTSSPARDDQEVLPHADARGVHPVAAVREAQDRSVAQTPEQRVGRAGVVGAVIGAMVAIPTFFVLGIATGAGTAGAIGLALFCAFWGGLGLGAMWGAVAGFTKEERRELLEARERGSAILRQAAERAEPADH